MSSLAFIQRSIAYSTALTTLTKGLVLHGQNYLIYPGATAPKCHLAKPGMFGLDYEDLELKTSDNVTLRCYLLLQQPSSVFECSTDREVQASSPTVIMFHGNACTIGDIIPFAKKFYSKMCCNVLMLSYRVLQLETVYLLRKVLCEIRKRQWTTSLNMKLFAKRRYIYMVNRWVERLLLIAQAATLLWSAD